MKTAEGLRNEAITAALDEAVKGRVDRLYKLLALASGLPGPRMNLAVALGFANECALRGKLADKLVDRMAALTAEEAPGASELEFLPVCGVLALATRASRDAKMRGKVLTYLHDTAEDTRFRVRDAVAVALARVGAMAGDEVVTEVQPWMDGFFQAAAVVRALGEPLWLTTIDDGPAVIERLDEAFLLARDAPRSATRWPGWKALVEELAKTPAGIATRFGVPVFDMLVRWAGPEMPELREVVAKNLKDKKIGGRFHGEVQRVHTALGASAPVPRDPTAIVPGMRSRGKKRGRR
jgi:hypothetical protein